MVAIQVKIAQPPRAPYPSKHVRTFLFSGFFSDLDLAFIRLCHANPAPEKDDNQRRRH